MSHPWGHGKRAGGCVSHPLGRGVGASSLSCAWCQGVEDAAGGSGWGPGSQVKPPALK